MRWVDFEADAGRLGELARDRLLVPGVVLVVTMRRDGTPRLSPIEPLIVDGDLWLSMLWGSRKATDLVRNPQVLVHNIVSSRDGADGEVKLHGRAVAVDDAEPRRRYCEAVSVLGWQPEEPYFHLFRIDVDDVTFIRYGDSGDQYVARWPQGREFVRRATSATSVGDPEPHAELFDSQPHDEA